MTGPAQIRSTQQNYATVGAYLDIVSLVVVTTFAEEPVVNDTVDVELIEERIAVLGVSEKNCHGLNASHTLETEAVKTTTSYSSPTRFMNWSTPGRLMTYTLWYWPSISTGMVKSA